MRLRVTRHAEAVLQTNVEQQHDTLNEIWTGLVPAERETVLLGLKALGDSAWQVRLKQGMVQETDQTAFFAKDAAQQNSLEAVQGVVDLMSRRVRGQA